MGLYPQSSHASLLPNQSANAVPMFNVDPSVLQSTQAGLNALPFSYYPVSVNQYALRADLLFPVQSCPYILESRLERQNASQAGLQTQYQSTLA